MPLLAVVGEHLPVLKQENKWTQQPLNVLTIISSLASSDVKKSVYTLLVQIMAEAGMHIRLFALNTTGLDQVATVHAMVMSAFEHYSTFCNEPARFTHLAEAMKCDQNKVTITFRLY